MTGPSAFSNLPAITFTIFSSSLNGTIDVLDVILLVGDILGTTFRGAVEWLKVNYPELEKEKWDVDTNQVKLMADEALEEYTKALTKLEEQL